MYKKGQRKGVWRFKLKPTSKPKQVMLAGDFSMWEPVAMRKQKDGSYACSVSLDTGSYQYKFIVDGEWISDPDHPQRVADPFGGHNSLASCN